jgi:predicted DNA-binding protein
MPEKSVRLSLTLRESLDQAVKNLAEKQGRSYSAVAQDLIEVGLYGATLKVTARSPWDLRVDA